MKGPSPVSKILTEKNIHHQEFIHKGLIRSIQQAAEERKQSVHQVVRSILFRLSEGRYAMVLIAGPAQVDWKKLRQFFHQSRVSMASPEEVKKITGYEIGAVAPFGIPEEISILADNTIFSQSLLSLGSGRRGTAIIITQEKFLQALGKVEMGSFIKTEI